MYQYMKASILYGLQKYATKTQRNASCDNAEGTLCCKYVCYILSTMLTYWHLVYSTQWYQLWSKYHCSWRFFHPPRLHSTDFRYISTKSIPPCSSPQTGAKWCLHRSSVTEGPFFSRNHTQQQDGIGAKYQVRVPTGWDLTVCRMS